jgi:molecular chaperone HtpG
MYCNQVFVAENSKELLPEWLTLLKGAIDCPDLPLNVSRSYLQNDPEVKKISSHIIKKVADKLVGLAKTDRENFEKCWDDIHGFVKFGMLRDDSFYERMAEYVIFKSSSGSYTTLDSYLERMEEKTDGKIIYSSDPIAQASFVKMFIEHGLEAIVADTMIDSHFIQHVEMKSSRKFKFSRIDADVSKHLLSDDSAPEIVDPSDQKTARQRVEELFASHMKNDKLKIRVEKLKADRVPAILLLDENARRFKEMSARSGGGFNFPGSDELTLVVNQNNGAIRNLLTLAKSFNRDEDVDLIVKQIYDLAYLQKGELSAEMMHAFLDRSARILEKLAKTESTLSH